MPEIPLTSKRVNNFDFRDFILFARPKFKFDIVQSLLKAKADPNFKNPKDGRSALSFACTNQPGLKIYFITKE